MIKKVFSIFKKILKIKKLNVKLTFFPDYHTLFLLFFMYFILFLFLMH